MGRPQERAKPAQAWNILRGGADVFFDEQALLIADPDHSEQEERFILLGLSSALRTLLVCHCYRREGDVIRLISARRADRQEREEYQNRWTP